MKKKNKVDRDNLQLDAYEQEIEDSINTMEIKPPDAAMKKRIKKLQQIAQESLKRKAISLRMIEKELATFKKKASEEGLPYQTLLNLLIHKYNRGEITFKLSK